MSFFVSFDLFVCFVVYIRKTPNFAGGIGALNDAEMAEAERVARLRRIEDAVVPEARRRVVRRSLALVLVEDRPADAVFVLSAERLARRARADRA